MTSKVQEGEVWTDARRYVLVVGVPENGSVVVRSCDKNGIVKQESRRSWISIDRFLTQFNRHLEHNIPPDGYWWALIDRGKQPCVVAISDHKILEPCSKLFLRRDRVVFIEEVKPPKGYEHYSG